MKGIILVGGSGSRLYPLTTVTSKQLLPVYDKPMIYYPMSVLMLAGIRDILVISTPEDTPRMKSLLGDGSKFGLKLEYKIQPSPDGLAQAFLLGEDFIGDDGVCMILGDNILYGSGLITNLKNAVKNAEEGIATVFGYYVQDPKQFGVIEFDDKDHVISIEEKPEIPKSNYAVIGLYFYPKNVSRLAHKVIPSIRGELEITSLNQMYLNKDKLNVITFGRGVTWLDAGTPEALAEASISVKMIEEHQGLMISCPEEIAFNSGWITKKELKKICEKMGKNKYSKYLLDLADGKNL